MHLYAGCKLRLETTEPTAATFMLKPRSVDGQRILTEEWVLEPPVTTTEYDDSYGNHCQRLVVPRGHFLLQTKVVATTTDTLSVNFEAPFIPAGHLPPAALQFLLPSRYCQSDQMGALAYQIVKNVPLGYAQVEAIRSWIAEHITYCYGTSNVSTSALETIATRTGVCRDFAHLGIALCRSLNIPARMVVGYLYDLKPMDLHAWFEAYVGDRWYAFDATQPEPRGNRVVIAYGRDAADVAFMTQFGAIDLTEMQVWVDPAAVDLEC